MNHSPENPVWKIPGFCYLEVNRNHFWPANPTVYTFAQFGQKYRKAVSFMLVETQPGKHFGIRTFPNNNTGAAMSWKQLEFLATTDKSYMCVGGNDDNSVIKPLDGTNYKQWAPKMRAYLMSKELWGYVSGSVPQPKAANIPKKPTPNPDTRMKKEAYDKQVLVFNEANEKFVKWGIEDDKAVGSMQLRMADKLGYLIRDTTFKTWNNIKSQFDVSGPAAIFVDFRYVINFKFDKKKDPSVQVAELNTKLDVLAAHNFTLDERIQAMIILSGLPQSWDSIQGAILANMPMNKLNIAAIMPVLQEEWQCRQARCHEHKSSHLCHESQIETSQHKTQS